MRALTSARPRSLDAAAWPTPPGLPARRARRTSPVRRLSRSLPRGRHLPQAIWSQRHNGLVLLLWVQAPWLFGFALYQGHSPLDGLVAGLPIAVTAGFAMVGGLTRRIRSASVAIGLVVSCSILVYLSGGSIEAHFSYFVVIAFLTLYQEWMPFLVAIAFVLFEHGIVGVIAPRAVYNHPGMADMPGMGAVAGSEESPWKWALIHAAFVFAASFANLLAWRLTEHEAMHDGLTGLPNRVLFIDSLRAICNSRMRRTSAVLFVDLDNFKDANDGFGHESGDELLRTIAVRLRAAAGPDDLIARLGGDEFGVILRGVADEHEARIAAEHYLGAFSEPFALRGVSFATSASFGLVLAGERLTTATTLMRNADLAMYEAKSAGGAQISLYRPDMHDLVVRRALFQAELAQGLEQDEFIVHYQPLVDVGDGRIVGNEALIRWQHPERGMVPPVEFIAIAEHSGLIVSLGRWILRTACAQTRAWHDAHPDEIPVTISVNLSPRQLADVDLISTVADALSDSGLDASYLCLEITEGALIKDFDSALPKLVALKALGVTLALDDFGTGYSSLSYLRQLPVDSVKIDRSFVTDLTAGRDPAIIAAIIDLAHALRLSVTAEGVETGEQLAALRGMGSDLAQGYLLGRPMAPEQMGRLLAQRSAGQPAA